MGLLPWTIHNTAYPGEACELTMMPLVHDAVRAAELMILMLTGGQGNVRQDHLLAADKQLLQCLDTMSRVKLPIMSGR